MSDQPLSGFSPEVDSEQASQSGVEEPVAYVTPKDLDSKLSAVEQRLLRAIQSTKDRRISKLEERVQKQAEALRAQGTVVTDDDIAQVSRELVQQELRKGAQQPEEDDAQSAPPAPSADAVRKVRVRAAELTSQYKFEIERGDPEWVRLSRLATDDPDIYNEALSQEYALKARRLGVKAPQAQTPNQGNPDRVIGTGGSAVSSDLMTQYQKAVGRENLTKDERLAIRQEYRSKGLPI